MKTPTPVISSSEDIDRFNRPPRIQRPLPQHEITLPAPPVPTNPPRRSLLTSLLPGLGMFFAMALMGWWSFSQTGSWFMIVPMLAMAVVAISSSILMYREQGIAHKQTVKEQQEHFENIFNLKQQELSQTRLHRIRAGLVEF